MGLRKEEPTCTQRGDAWEYKECGAKAGWLGGRGWQGRVEGNVEKAGSTWAAGAAKRQGETAG